VLELLTTITIDKLIVVPLYFKYITIFVTFVVDV